MASNRVLISLTQEQDKRTGPAERSADLEEGGSGPYERMIMMISKMLSPIFVMMSSLCQVEQRKRNSGGES